MGAEAKAKSLFSSLDEFTTQPDLQNSGEHCPQMSRAL
jgi:hypothetical protein